MKNLLIVKFPYETAWGGEEEIHLLLAKKLREHKKETALLSCCPYSIKSFLENGFLAKKFWREKLDPVAKKSIFFFPFTGLILFFSAFFWLFYFKRKGFDRILCLRLQEKLAFFIPAKVLGYKIFWGEHIGFGKWIKQNPFLFLYKIFAQKVKIITPSSEMKEQIEGLFKKNSPNITVLHNTFDEKEFPLKNLENTNKNLVFGYAGRLSKEKGLFFLLDLFKKLTTENQNIILKIAGSGPLEEDLKEKAEKLNLTEKVIFLGFLDKKALNDFYDEIDIFCLFSEHESFGISILEAMYKGKVVLANGVGGILDIISSGKNGFLIKKFDQDEAFVLLNKLLNDVNLRKEIGQNAQKHFQENFSSEIFAQKALKIFFS